MTLRKIISIVVLALAVTAVRGQMTVTQSSTAPANNVVISQISAGYSSAWRTQSGLRQVGQTFPGGFVLDKVTIKIDSVQNSDLDGDSFTMYIYTHANATTPTVASTVATLTGNLPPAFKSNFDGSNVYLTFDLTTDLTLTEGQQYSFFLDPSGFSSTANCLVCSEVGTSGYTGGIGLQHGGPAQLMVWTGVSTPADLTFYLQEPSPAAAIVWANPGQSNVTAVSASAYATVSNNLDGAVLVWDTTDKGIVSTNNWSNRVGLGAWNSGDVVTGQMTNLLEKTGYVWRLYGFDATTNGWLSAQAFITADITPPAIQTLAPANGATHVAPYANLVSTFGETIVAGSSGNITIKKVSDNSTVETFAVTNSPRLAFSGAQVTINPTADLATNTTYYVEIDAGAIRDLSDNAFTGLSGSSSWSFTTVQPTALTVTQADSAPANVVAISQTNASHNAQFAWGRAFATDGMPRDVGQSFPGGFVLDKITVRLNDVSASVYDGHGVNVLLFELYGGGDYTADTLLTAGFGTFPADMKADFDGGNKYLTFDIADTTLDTGKQYGFRLQIASQASAGGEYMKLDALANTVGNYTGGIGLYRTSQDTESQLTVWTGANTPADLLFYLQEAAVPMVTSLSAAAPAGKVAISQTNADSNVQFQWQRPLGTDGNPRDAGQSFLVGAGGLVLDRITVNIATLSVDVYDSQTVRLEIFTLDSASDFTPNSKVVTAVGNFPSNMKASFDSGSRYLTFDIPDVTLSGGQYYGFLLKHGAQKALGSDMRLSVKTSDEYSDGTGIVQQNRSTYSAMTSSADLQFYLQKWAPDGTVILIQ